MGDESRAYVTPRLAAWRRWTDGPLIVVAVGSLPFLLLELRRDELTEFDGDLVAAVNVGVLVVFAVDYLVELALASPRHLFVRSEWSSLLIVVSQALALLPGLASLGVLRATRAARLARAFVVVLRLFAIGGATAKEGRTYLRRHAAGLALAVAALTWVTSAAAFALVEGTQDDGRLHSFFDALWWATTTITTVGYGDLYPTTAAGRVVAGFLMFVGVSAFAVVTARVAAFLTRDESDASPPLLDGTAALDDAA